MNQHKSRKAEIMRVLREARAYLALGDIHGARSRLEIYGRMYRAAPASTRRRWRAGR